jgi:hypothetical protein
MYCCSVGALKIFIFMDTILDFVENVLPPLEHKLLVMLGRIGEAVLLVCEVLYTFKRQ